MREISVLLEREHELEALRGLLDRAGAGNGGIALIEGAAGVGKTTLIERCLVEAAEGGMRTLQARGGELEASFPFGVCHQLFGAILDGADTEQRERLLAGAAAHAAAVFDEEAVPRGRSARTCCTPGCTGCTGSPRTSPTTHRC